MYLREKPISLKGNLIFFFGRFFEEDKIVSGEHCQSVSVRWHARSLNDYKFSSTMQVIGYCPAFYL